MPEDVKAPSHAEESYGERESIILRHLGEGELVAIHEHLSTGPGSADPGATHQESPIPDSTVAEEVAQ